MEANMLLDQWKAHGLYVLVAAWPVISMVLNAWFRKKTPEAWVAYGQANPRLAGIIRLISALGLDPVKAAKAAQQAIKGAADAAHTKNPKVADLIDSVTAEEEKKK